MSSGCKALPLREPPYHPYRGVGVVAVPQERQMNDALLSALTEIAVQAQQPHQPFSDFVSLPQIAALVRQFSLSSELEISNRDLSHKILVRGVKDSRLKGILEKLCAGTGGVIANPCCVFARHARDLACRLPMARVEATDVDPTWERIYRFLMAATRRTSPDNFSFRTESVYRSQLAPMPLAVCFFGGCGSLTDAALRLAVQAKARFVVGRACCHENIGRNSQISTRAFTVWNLGHRVKNRVYDFTADRSGYYFDASAGIETYPISSALRRAITPSGMLGCARHAVDCRLCQFVIDADRVAFLQENAYDVLGYGENMFVASRSKPEPGFST